MHSQAQERQKICQSTVAQSLISINDRVVRGQRENQKCFKLLKTYFWGDRTRCPSPIRKTYQVFVVNKDTLWVYSTTLGVIIRYSSPISEVYQVFVANKDTLSPLRGVELHPRCRITLWDFVLTLVPLQDIFSFVSGLVPFRFLQRSFRSQSLSRGLGVPLSLRPIVYFSIVMQRMNIQYIFDIIYEHSCIDFTLFYCVIIYKLI